MILQQTDNYIRACMKTWMFCESCIHAEKDNNSPRQLLIDKCRGCANSCFTVVCRIINNTEVMQEEIIWESALTCLLDCRECCEECEKHDYINDIQFCGEVCRFCAETLKELILPFNLN